jgi:hypothetical protein
MSAQVLSLLALAELVKCWLLVAAEAVQLSALAEQEESTTTLPHIYRLAL